MSLKDNYPFNLKKDFLASIVVFLVALPLCMGISIASGAPPILGLLSGIIGGIVVGFFSGSPLQVSGPAAGLAVMIFEFINKFGIEALAPMGVIVGLSQLIVYKLKLAEYFKAISPALIKGLLSGIGLLILASQIHVAFDANPIGSGLQNIVHIPNSFYKFVILEGSGQAPMIIALVTLISIILWQKFSGKIGKIIPGPLFAILLVTIASAALNIELKFINFSENLLNEMNFISLKSFTSINVNLIVSAVAIAFVASAETLLSVAAVDKISGRGASDYNKEIMAQGLGNMLAGFVGALPITGVIVRSSANVETGGSSRYSAIFHGIWLFALVFFFSNLLSYIPVSALAGILLFVGWKLLDIPSIPKLIQKNKAEALIYFVTFGLIVTVDLLTGVVAGFVTSVFVLAHKLQNLEIEVTEKDEEISIQLKGTASFLSVPKISEQLAKGKMDKKVTVCIKHLNYMDWAVEEQINQWKDIHEKSGGQAQILSNKNPTLT